jgi:hypothetical protein
VKQNDLITDSHSKNRTFKLGTVAAGKLQSNRTWKDLRHQFELSWPNVTKYLPLSAYDQSFKNPCWWHDSFSPELAQSKYFTRYILSLTMKGVSGAVSQPVGPRLYCLPYFFLVGMAKCATTDLYSRMMEHPQIVRVPKQLKEPHWWNHARNYGYTFLDYIHFFSLAAKQIRDGSQNGIQMVTGDATGTTISDFAVYDNEDSQTLTLPEQIYSILPQAKLIAIFRDPIQRFYSDYVYFSCTRQLNLNRTKIEFNPECSPKHLHREVTSMVSRFQTCTKLSSFQFCVHQNQFDLLSRVSTIP